MPEAGISFQGPKKLSAGEKIFCTNKNLFYICSPKTWEFSSAGSEHLPYKQRVGGSNPSTPTASLVRGFFYSLTRHPNKAFNFSFHNYGMICDLYFCKVFF